MTAARFANPAQATTWNGADGIHWADHHDRYDAMAEGFDTHLFAAAALTETSRVVDVGCGTGHTTRAAARHAPRGHVVGIDVSAPMLDRARRLAAGLGNVTFVHADAQLHPFEAASFDVAISRAGVMFFADPVAAFANIRGGLRPGGRLVFLTHSHVGRRFQAVYDAVAEHVPLPASTPGVASFADPEYVERTVTRAGFTEFGAARVEIRSTLGRDAADAADFLVGGPLRPLLGDAGDVERVRQAVARVLRDDEDSGAVRLPAHAWVYTAAVG